MKESDRWYKSTTYRVTQSSTTSLLIFSILSSIYYVYSRNLENQWTVMGSGILHGWWWERLVLSGVVAELISDQDRGVAGRDRFLNNNYQIYI